MILGKKIAVGLGGLAGLLALVAAGQGAGIGRSYSLAAPEAPGPDAAPPPQLEREAVRMRAWVDYGQVLARPLFNESRAPEIEETADAGDAPATQPLTLALTGVILTRDLQIALVTDPAKNETERVRVGQPLAGERAGWTLVELKPRAAVFEGAGLGRTELALTVDVQGAAPPAPAPAPAVAAAPAAPVPVPQPAAPGAAPAQAPGQPASAEEIRRRIEERRRQLREEAQKMLQQQGSTQ